MPVIRCPNGKYKIGSGKCMYKSRQSAVKAYQAYMANKGKPNKHTANRS